MAVIYIGDFALHQHPKYKNIYATRDGRVFRIKTRNSCLQSLELTGADGTIFKETGTHPSHGDGYHQVTVSHKKTKGRHLLVLETFIPKPSPELECRHLNGIAGDDRLENLEWGTHHENVKDSIKHGTFSFVIAPHGERNGQSKITDSIARLIKSRKGECKAALAREFGISVMAVYYIQA